MFAAGGAGLTEEFNALLGKMWELFFQLPVLMGYGAFWALSDYEAKTLTDSSKGLLKTVPAKQRKAIMAMMDKYVPLTTFAGTLGIILYPRIQMTKVAMAQTKGGTNATGSNVHEFKRESEARAAGGANQSGNSVPVHIERQSPFASVTVDTQSAPIVES